MDVTITLWVLAGSGVASVALFAAKGLLDQLPGVFDSWRAARRAWRGDPPPALELHSCQGACTLDHADARPVPPRPDAC